MWSGLSRPSVPSRSPHTFFTVPSVGPPFTPPPMRLRLPRAPPPQQQSWRVGSTISQWLLQHHGAHSPMPATDWVADSGTFNHTTQYSGSISSPHPPSTFHPHSIIVGNGSILPVTSVGDSVLPRPFYLNDVLVAPDLVQSLLSVRHFTIDNSCSMEFDPFGLSVKDLATWSVIVRYDSSGPLYTIPAFCVGHLLRRCSTVHPSSHGFDLHLAPPSWSSWPRRPLLAVTQLSDYMS
jgi:hypothetical protein